MANQYLKFILIILVYNVLHDWPPDYTSNHIYTSIYITFFHFLHSAHHYLKFSYLFILLFFVSTMNWLIAIDIE